MSNIKKLITAAILLALTIIMSRLLSIQMPLLKIGFSFIPLMISAILLGPAWSTIIAVFADLIGFSLFPSGNFFIGFTISAFLTGLTYGLFLYKKDGIFKTKILLIRLLLSSTIVLIFISGLLNSYWLFLMYGKSLIAILPIRIIKEVIMMPVHIIAIYLVDKSMRRLFIKYMFQK